MPDAGNYSLQPWGEDFTEEDPLNKAIEQLGLGDPSIQFVRTQKVCSILKLMPPIYRLADGDPITAVLSAIGDGDNEIGGVPCVSC